MVRFGRQSRLLMLLGFIIIAGGVFVGFLVRYHLDLAEEARAPGQASLSGPDRPDAAGSPGQRDESPSESRDNSQDGSAPSAIPNPNFTLQGSTMSITGPDGEQEWKLEVGEVRISEDDNKAELTGIKAVRFKGGKVALRVEAGRAIVDWNTRNLVFRGGVKVLKPGPGPGSGPGPGLGPGCGFRAVEAEWRADSEELRAAGNVEYWNGATVLSGGRLVADGRLQRVWVEGPARLVTTDDEG